MSEQVHYNQRPPVPPKSSDRQADKQQQQQGQDQTFVDMVGQYAQQSQQALGGYVDYFSNVFQGQSGQQQHMHQQQKWIDNRTLTPSDSASGIHYAQQPRASIHPHHSLQGEPFAQNQQAQIGPMGQSQLRMLDPTPMPISTPPNSSIPLHQDHISEDQQQQQQQGYFAGLAQYMPAVGWFGSNADAPKNQSAMNNNSPAPMNQQEFQNLPFNDPYYGGLQPQSAGYRGPSATSPDFRRRSLGSKPLNKESPYSPHLLRNKSVDSASSTTSRKRGCCCGCCPTTRAGKWMCAISIILILTAIGLFGFFYFPR
jgi:hypothetical protein